MILRTKCIGAIFMVKVHSEVGFQHPQHHIEDMGQTPPRTAQT